MLEKGFESILWNSRLVVLVAVITSLATAFAVFYMASVDVWNMLSHVPHYGDMDLPAETRADMRAMLVAHVVEIIDGYLLATVLIIFALGLYELFISRIDQAANSETHSRVLFIRNLDDLKNRLAKVVLMILIVKFFEHALNMDFDTALDLLTFAGGIALIGLALFLTHASEKHGESARDEDASH
ncbi:MAG: YqhA family protein [Gammaproteobacteria bacterium]|nr:MAG: YqhA family protein [Gammaproteobacteria bacterium]